MSSDWLNMITKASRCSYSLPFVKSLGKEMSLSQSKRAVEAREWRVGLRQRRRFNTLLNGYMSVKHEKIYDEYSQFFQSLDQSHPEARDLTKTKTYKKWKKEQLAAKEVNVEWTEEDQQDEDIQANDEDEDLTNKEAIVERAEEDQQGEGMQANDETDILSVAVEEILPQNPMNIYDVDSIINDIVNELQQDEEIRNVLDDQLVHPNYEDEDEGIGLNTQTELEAIIEPFDYQLEVEGFDF